jgi:hypothetical protein
VRITAQELRTRYAELRELVNSWDPVGLIEAGLPEDEYDCVVGPILRRLEERQNAAAIAAFLDSEFCDHFGAVARDSSSFAVRAVSWYTERWPDTKSTPLGDSV